MPRHCETIQVLVGGAAIGGGAPVSVQAMTNTPSSDAAATASQVCALAEAGAEFVRFTVDTPAAAGVTSEIAARVRDAGSTAALVGDFHYNGHVLLREFPDCARALDKYRVNPGNAGASGSFDRNFETFCKIAIEHDKPVRIGVNAGSLNQAFVEHAMRRNAELGLGRDSEQVLNDCMIASALESCETALAHGLREDQIVLSAKSASPPHLIALYRELAARTRQPLHLGLTEAGMGIRGLVWSSAAMAVLLEEGIGDTVRVSLTPEPGGDRCAEVRAACELLQALGLRAFSPSITACPGCGRTDGAAYLSLAADTQRFIAGRLSEWRKSRRGIEALRVAVMGCIVNGPGESKSANVGISLPGSGENPVCPVFVDGRIAARLRGTPGEVAAAFHQIIEDYVAKTYPAD